MEEWNNEWEIVENRNYNPYVYKPFKFELSIYKQPKDKKVYLNFDSKIEEQFIESLEEHKDKILWWWQNGNEHMALNFGIKYSGGSTFQPDFWSCLKMANLAFLTQKASGYNEDDNKIKAEALQKYIKRRKQKKERRNYFRRFGDKGGRTF